jgi:hypothetical protein
LCRKWTVNVRRIRPTSADAAAVAALAAALADRFPPA